MKRDEFILALRQSLISHNISGIDEIIRDFEDHFTAAVQEGKSEDEIAEMLGQPDLIASQYQDEPADADLSDADLSDADLSDADLSDAALSETVHSVASQPDAGSSDNPAGRPQHIAEKSVKPEKYFRPAAGSSNSKKGTVNQKASKNDKINNLNGTAAAGVQNIPPADQNGYQTSFPTLADQAPGYQTSAYQTTASGYQTSAYQTTASQLNQNEVNSGKVIALILINLFIMIPLFFVLLGILIGFWSTSIGIGVGAAALFAAALLQQGVQVQILVLFGISLTALCFLFIIASYYLSKASILGLIRYIRWNGTWVKEK